MSSEPSGWDHYRSFLAVARHGSLSAAARALNLTQPTLGRHIAALEDALNISLFSRSQHGLKPTDEAHALLPHAEAMALASEALLRAASAERGAERGTVRITASEIVGVAVLPEILAGFHAAYPGIAIELAPTDRNEDLLRREADIAVRMTPPTQSALIARRIGTVRIGLYAHRDYIVRHGLPRTVEQLAGHTLLGFDRKDFMARTRAPGLVARDSFSLRSDNDLALLAALRAGYGIGGCQTPLAAREPDLVPVLPGHVAFALEMWLVMHADLKSTRRVRLLFDHLAKGLSAYLARSSASRSKPAGKSSRIKG